MSQAPLVLPAVAPSLPAPSGSPETAETGGFSGTFDDALNEQLGVDRAAADAASAVAGPPAAAETVAGIAADGKNLPPVLPVAVPSELPEPSAPVTAEPTGSSLAELISASQDVARATADPASTAPAPAVAVFRLTPELAATDGRSFPASSKPLAMTSGDSPAPVTAGFASRFERGAEPILSDAGREPLSNPPDAPAAVDSVVKPEIRTALRFDLPASAAPFAVPGAAVTPDLLAATGSQPSTTTPLPLTTGVSVPFGQAQWGQAMSQQVVWVVNQGVQRADLHLSPPELGPLSVRVEIDQDQASISFHSAHAAVREAVEAALPRLRDLLAGQGMSLADVNVTAHDHSQHAHQFTSGGNGSGSGRSPDADSTDVSPAVTHGIARGMLDVYA